MIVEYEPIVIGISRFQLAILALNGDDKNGCRRSSISLRQSDDSGQAAAVQSSAGRVEQ
jgi:hypothetical protein